MTEASSGSIVHVVELDGLGAVGAFSSRTKAQVFIDSAEHTYPVDDLSVTALVVDE
jgi:hypothetical protein